MIVPQHDIAEAQWDAFVRAHPQGSPFHLSAWGKAVTACFPHQSYGFAVCEGGEIRALLPLFLVRKLMGGRALLSVPYAVYGGPLAQDAQSLAALLAHLRDLVAKHGVAYAELRTVESIDPDLPANHQYVTFIKDLPEQPEDCLASLPRKARAAARKAGEQFALTARVEADAVARLHQLFVLNKRGLGSPAFPLRFFAALKQFFAEDCDFLFVEHEGQTVSGVMTFYFRDLVMPYYSGLLPAQQTLQANNFMYLKLMEHGVARGYRRFDFGRSRVGTGAYDFKVNQGFVATPVHSQYLLGSAEAVPDLSPGNPRFDLPKRIWRQLPLPLARSLGGWLTRYLP